MVARRGRHEECPCMLQKRPPPPRHSRWLRLAIPLVLAASLALPISVVTLREASKTSSFHARTAALPAPPGATSHSPSLLPLVKVSGWDPRPDGDEHNDEVALSHDGHPATAWFTESFATSDFSKLKPGVGLLADLGSIHSVSMVQLTLPSAGPSIQLRAADEPFDSDQGYQLVQAVENVPLNLTLRPLHTRARYWLVEIVRLTRLPAAGANRYPYKAGIAEMNFFGT